MHSTLPAPTTLSDHLTALGFCAENSSNGRTLTLPNGSHLVIDMHPTGEYPLLLRASRVGSSWITRLRRLPLTIVAAILHQAIADNQ